jgi:LPS-assembly lipoprotein
LGVRKDTTATRTDLIVKASFKLIDLSSKKTVVVGAARSVISYNILDADFATMSVMSDARNRAAKDLATRIRSRLSVFKR